MHTLHAGPDVTVLERTYLCAQAWESVGVVDGDWGGGGAWSTTAGSTSSWSATATGSTVTAWATGSTALATESTALTTTAWSITTATATASGIALLWGLDEALVDLNDLLLLALTGALGLATGTGNKLLLLLLLKSLSSSPLLVLLGTLVGLAGGGSLELQLGLSLLDKVVSVRDVVVGLLLLESASVSVDWSALTILLDGDLLVGVGISLTGLLGVELGLTIVSTPSLSSLLGGVTSDVLGVAVVAWGWAGASTTSGLWATATSVEGVWGTGAILSWAGAVGVASGTGAESSLVATWSTAWSSVGWSSWSLAWGAALVSASWGLIDDLHWWLWLLVGVLIVVVAEKLVQVLGNDLRRHLVLVYASVEAVLQKEQYGFEDWKNRE